LRVHCKETGRTPTQLIEERIEQLQSKDPRMRGEAEDTVLEIYRKIAERVTGTAINYFRKMKSFYKHNYCPLSCTDPGYTVQRAARDRRVLEKLTKGRIREICERATLEGRLAILIAAESGGRIGAITDLTYRDVKDDLERDAIPATIWLKHKITLAVAKYPTFICRDAIKLLRIVLKQRDELKDNTLIFSIIKHTIQNFLCGLNSGIHAHLFRKRFQTILEDCGVPLNWVDRLLGHVPRGAQGATYSIPPIAKLREQYSKAMSKLEIYGSSEPAFNGELGHLSKCFAEVLSKYLNQPISEEEISRMLEVIYV
jgi:integrase